MRLLDRLLKVGSMSDSMGIYVPATGLQKLPGSNISDSGAVSVDYFVALSGNTASSRFYRLRADKARRLTGIQFNGDTVTLTYE